MTFLATIAIFTVALSFVWLATQRSGQQHECSCSRSKRVLTEYERIHNPGCGEPKATFVPLKAIVRASRDSVS